MTHYQRGGRADLCVPCSEAGKFILFPWFSCCFLITPTFFPATPFCNQRSHSGSYNYSTSSVQLTAPEQSCGKNGSHLQRHTGCRREEPIVRRRRERREERGARRRLAVKSVGSSSPTNPVVSTEPSTPPGFSSRAPPPPPPPSLSSPPEGEGLLSQLF